MESLLVGTAAEATKERSILARTSGSPVSMLLGSMHRSALIVVLLLLVVVPATQAAAPVVRSGQPSSGAIALTFDDGIGVAACERIGSILRAHGVRATFFINGRHLLKAPKRWRRILKGMAIGNHTRSHPDLTRLSERAMREQLRSNEKIHENVLRRPMLKVMRPPFGSYDYRVRRAAGRLGYRRTVLWNVDPRDWSSASTAASIVSRSVGAPRGSIIVMHCSRMATAQALPAIIRHYRARGIRMVTLHRLLAL